MAMEIVQVIANAHEDSITSIAYNRVKREIYSAADGDKAIKVWDLRSGQLLRTQTVHRGMVTSLAYASSVKLLFSGSIDGSIGVWTDKGNLLQIVPTGWPVFSIAWGSKQRILVAGGNSVLHVYKVDMSDALRLKHARHSIQPAARQQQQQPDSRALGLGCNSSGPDAPQVLRRVCPAFKGWKIHQRPGAFATGAEQLGRREHLTAEDLEANQDDPVHDSSLTDPTHQQYRDTESVVASSVISGSRQKAETLSKAAPSVVGGGNRQREEDYYGVCHTDVVKGIVITEGGKIFTAGFDRAICAYDIDKLDKPKEAFKKVRDCARAGLTSLTFDIHNNVLLAGSLEGALRIWSVEGRCLDKFEGLSNKPISIIHLPHAKQWWANGRSGRVAVLDPRAPAVITEYVAAPNQLLDHSVELLVAPSGSELVLAGTAQRQLVVWQFNPHAPHRVFSAHADWVEGLLVCDQDCDADVDQAFFSFCADGHVRSWALDTEQNCDIYRLVEETQVADCNVLCMLHLLEQHCIAAGCEDGIIRMHYAEGHGPTPGTDGGPVPLSLEGHEGKITGLLALPGNLMLSCSEDKTFRVWNLTTLKQVHAEMGAHDTPINSMDYCAARSEVATCCLGSKVKVWSLVKPTQPRLKMVLDHSEASNRPKSAGPKGPGDVNADGKSNMQWLTRSDMEGLDSAPSKKSNALPAIVAEAIAHASEDIPEVTQVRWVGYRDCWVTTADDEMMRLWSTDGKKLTEFAFKGGSCKYLYVDEENQLVLASTADKCVYLFNLDTPMPLARFAGHDDIISGIGYLSTLDCYITSSWDTTLRLWKRPQVATTADAAAAGGTTVPAPRAQSAGAASGVGGSDAAYLLPEDSEEGGDFVSEYEKAHPLVPPKGLNQDHTLALLQAIGVSDNPAGSATKGGRRAGRLGGRGARDAAGSDDDSMFDDNPDMPGTLGAKLQELGKRLLQDINETATKVVADKGASSWMNPGSHGLTALQRNISSKSAVPGNSSGQADAGRKGGRPGQQ